MLCASPYTRHLEWSNSEGQEVDRHLPGAGGREDGELAFSGFRFSAGDAENHLEVDGGDGCATA